MLSALLTAIADRAAKQADDAQAAYRKLVASVADEKPVDPAAAAKVLDAAGRTAADLDRHVRRTLERRQLRATAATRPEAEAKKAEADRRVIELEVAFQQAEQQYLDSFNALTAAVAQADADVQAAAAADGRLMDPSAAEDAADLNARLAELHARRRALSERQTFLRDQLRSHEGHWGFVLDEAAPPPPPPPPIRYPVAGLPDAPPLAPADRPFVAAPVEPAAVEQARKVRDGLRRAIAAIDQQFAAIAAEGKRVRAEFAARDW